MSRDDFLAKTKMDLARRAGFKCSICRAPTSGPAEELTKAVSLGEAGHIQGAAQGAKRFNPLMTTQERRDITNGIWLCRNCHGRIDRDENMFTTERLFNLKRVAEEKASEELGLPPKKSAGNVVNNIFHGDIHSSNFNLGEGQQHITTAVDTGSTAREKFKTKEFGSAKQFFGKLRELGEGDDINDLMYVISGLSEKHVSKFRLSEVNEFYSALDKIQNNKFQALATLLWLIIYHEFSSSRSGSRCRDEDAPEKLNDFFVYGHSLSSAQKELTKNIIFYSEEVKCLLR